MDISKFTSSFDKLGGPLQASKFRTTIVTPQVLLNRPAIKVAANEMTFMCRTSSLPGISLATEDRYFPQGFGNAVKRPWNAIFTDVDLRFILDSKGYVHNYFTTWLDSIVKFNNINSNQFLVSYPETYMSKIIIEALDVRDKAENDPDPVVVKYELENAWPIFINDVNGDWGESNEVAYLPVRFAYSKPKISYPTIQTPVRTTRQNPRQPKTPNG